MKSNIPSTINNHPPPCHINLGHKPNKSEGEGTYSRFSAFFLFSAPDPADVADRLTALVVLGGPGLIPPAPPPTLALAVPSGDGDVIRSLLSLSLNREDIDVGRVLAGED